MRKLSVTGYVEWVLGDLRPKTAMQITTEINPGNRCYYLQEMHITVNSEVISAFFDVDDKSKSFTSDRTEFLGRNGTYKNPEAMGKAKLSGRVGAGPGCLCVYFNRPWI